MIIEGREIGAGEPPFIICEISSSHRGSLASAMKLIREAKNAGADAVKMQCFLPETITCNARRPEFVIEEEGPWKGRHLFDLYTECATPRGWFEELYAYARDLGILPFSTVASCDDVDFLESFGPDFNPAYKVSSYDNGNTYLLDRLARTGKPVFVSAGKASNQTLERADTALNPCWCDAPLVLHCVQEYPTGMKDANLHRLVELGDDWGDVGLSDHSAGSMIAAMAVALGACVFEKHLTLTPAGTGPDDAFAIGGHAFREYAQTIRDAWQAMQPRQVKEDAGYGRLRPSIRAIANIAVGDLFTPDNVAIIRPGGGLPASQFRDLIAGGRFAAKSIEKGCPIEEALVV